MTVQFVPATGKTIPDSFVADRGAGAKLLVVVHGISRNAAELATRFAADPRFDDFTICAPLFEKERFGQYQQLTAKRGRVPSDLALLDLIAMLAQVYGAETDRISLFGFSGGAQMVHRFAMLHPRHVSQVFAAAAGWYLMPDPTLSYPYGMADDLRFDPVSDAFLSIPMTIAVGTRDTRIDATVRQNDRINGLQGRTRVTRARKWIAAMQQCAADKGLVPKTQLVSLTDGMHDFGQCVREGGLIDAVANAFGVTHAETAEASEKILN